MRPVAAAFGQELEGLSKTMSPGFNKVMEALTHPLAEIPEDPPALRELVLLRLLEAVSGFHRGLC